MKITSCPKDIILIKQLQEKINILDTVKSLSEHNLVDLATIATELNTCAREKIAEIQEEIHAAREEAQIVREQLVSKESEVNHVLKEYFNSLVNVATEVEGLASESQKFKASLETTFLVMDEGLQDFAFFSPLIHAEKAAAERELDRLHSQRALLERYINKQHMGTSLVEMEKEKAVWSSTLSPKRMSEGKQRRRLWTPISFKNQGRKFWTPQEEEMLRMGVENIPWRMILTMGKNVFHQCTPSDLKDKWKNMVNKPTLESSAL